MLRGFEFEEKRLTTYDTPHIHARQKKERK